VERVTTFSAIATESRTPYHTIATGIHAIGEIGRKNWISGLIVWYPRAYQPAQRPSGIPTNAAIAKPTATRYTLAIA